MRRSTLVLLLALALAVASSFGVGAQLSRDLSTPASRLVGHWVTTGNTHYYFGPADSVTDVGTLIWVEASDTGRVVKHNYKIISQVPGGEDLTIQILFGAGGNRIDPYVVAKEGKTMRCQITVAGVEISQSFVRVDDRIRP